MPLLDMMMEDTDQPHRATYTFVEKTGCNALDLVAELQKLRLSFGGSRSFYSGKFIHRCAADLAVDRSLGVPHRKFECQPVVVVAYDLAALQRHRTPRN